MAKPSVADQIATLEAAAAVLKSNANAPASGVVPAGGLGASGGGAPNVTTGPLNQGDTRFSMTKALLGFIMNKNPEEAKFERNVMEKFRKGLIDTNSLPAEASRSDFWLPMNWDHLGEHANQSEEVKFTKAVFQASAETPDLDEIHRYKKTQSAYFDTLGGTLVAPPTQGPVIPLIRPQAAVMAAGAQAFPLPPQGRHQRPRITSAPDVLLVAESQDAPESDLGTDQMVLTAKKMAGMCRISEESQNFTSGTIDTLVRYELDRSLGLLSDALALYGKGGTSGMAGLTSSMYTSAIYNVQTQNPLGKGIGTNGNTLLPQYGDLLPTEIEERSFNQDADKGAWIMRPTAYTSATALRADAVLPGDQAGVMVDLPRRFQEGQPNMWRGRKVVRSTNVCGTRQKGASAANLSDAFFGIWSYCIMATYGAVSFTHGYDANSFKRGQYLIRGVMWGDVGFEYPAAFLWMPYVIGSQGQI